MSVNSILGLTPVASYSTNAVSDSDKATAAAAAKTETAAKSDKTAEKTSAASDAVTLGSTEQSNAGVYTKQTGKLTGTQIQSLEEQRVAAYTNMLTQMLSQQASYASKSGKKSTTTNISISAQISITSTTPADAAKAISADGEWGVDAVAGRIMDMAVSLSGGDTSKLAVLKDAVIKGFGQAREAWGDTDMPSITDQTYAEVMKRFDYWEQNGSMDGYKMNADTEKTTKIEE